MNGQWGNVYTFLFTRLDDSQMDVALDTSYKQRNYANPLSANHFMADPTAIEYDGRLYVYGTNDQQEFDYTQGLQSNSYGHITQLTCLSTADMVNWTDHGVIDVKALAPWIARSWAPSVVSRKEADGLTHFYLYFTNSAASIGVLTATSPTGPWRDPLGHALIDSKTPGLGKISQLIDPGAAINSDGTEAYLTFGGGEIMDTDLIPGNARIVRLGSDMISLSGDIKTISAPCHFEANELNYINGRWVYSYCTRWSISDNWSSYSTLDAPSGCSIVYMTATDPLADTWVYRGEMMPNPGRVGYPYGNNHTHLQKFGSSYYLFYHTQWLEHQMGIGGGYRNLQVNRVSVVERTGRITPLTAEMASLTDPQQLSYVNPYQEQSADMSAITTGNWWMVRGVDFSAGADAARQLSLRVVGSGHLDVCPSSLTNQPVASVEFHGDGEHQLVVPLNDELSSLCNYLYFIFIPTNGGKVLSWQFSGTGSDAIRDTNLQPSTDDSCFDLQGRRIGKPARTGLYLKNGRKTVLKR